MPAVALQDKSLRLAKQLACDLKLATQSSHEAKSRANCLASLGLLSCSPVTMTSRQTTLFGKNWPFTFQTYTSINTPYTHVLLRASRENFERETLEKTRLTHPQSSSFDSPNSSTLTFSIVTSLRGTLAKTFSHHTHICENAIWCLGSN